MLACMTSPLLSTPSLRRITTPLLILYPSKSKLSHAHMEICKGSHIPADKRVKKVKRELIVCLCVFVCACVRFFPSTLLVKVGGGSNQTSLAGLFSSFFLYSTHPRHTHSPTFVFATPHSLTPAGLADHLHTAIQKDTYSNYKPLVLAIS